MKRVNDDPQSAEGFNQRLELLLSTNELPTSDKLDAVHDEMLTIAHILATANLSSLSKGQISLRKHLLTKQSLPARGGLSRKVKLAATLGVLLLVVTAALVGRGAGCFQQDRGIIVIPTGIILTALDLGLVPERIGVRVAGQEDFG